MKENPILDRSIEFALEVIKLYQWLVNEKREYVMSKQLLRSGTSIGANLKEANMSISRKEFIAKAQIALKEASESEYWLELLLRSGYISESQSLMSEIRTIIRILSAIVIKAKENLKQGT